MPRKDALTLSLLLVVVVPFLLLGAGSARADDRDNGRNGRPVSLLTTIPIPGLVVFDISWVDQDTQRYFLADRSNAVVEVIDAKNDTFVRQIHANPAFRGFSGSNNTSGPNGVVVSGNFLFVTDANSRVVTINLNNNDQTVSDVSTGGADSNRADELAYDPRDGIILAVNNADDPPFATLISVNKATGHLTVGQRITFDKVHVGFDATNGAEQPVWDPGTRKFYLSIPEVDCPDAHATPPNPVCGGAFPNGAVVRIDPHSTGGVEAVFPVQACQPAGLTLGPHQDLLLGCSVIFNTDGQAWSGLADPKAAAPTQVIMDAKTGAVDKVVAGVGGSDEVWFNPGDGRYYTASRENPGAVPIAGNTPADPVLGVIDAEDQALIQVVPTFDTPGTSPPPRGGARTRLPSIRITTTCLYPCRRTTFSVLAA